MNRNKQPRGTLYAPTYYHSRLVPVVKHRHHPKRWAFLLFGIAVIAVIFIHIDGQKKVSAGVQNVTTTTSKGTIVSKETISKPATPTLDASTVALQKSVNAILTANSSDTIGVALIDMSTNNVQTFGSTAPFIAASTAKVMSAAAYYHLVETGKASLDDPMGIYTSGFNLKEMINDSDNDAWSLIENTIGLTNLQNYATSIGIPPSEYNVTNNTLTPAAMATLLTKLYEEQLLNTTDTAQLLSYMQNTNDETLIPAALPTSVTVYHKYGLLDDVLHDAAILVDGTHAYALVIYTSNSNGYSKDQAQTDIIHSLTQTIVSSIFPGSYN